MERGRAVAVLRVDIRPAGDEEPGDFGGYFRAFIPPPHQINERGVAVFALRVNIGPLGDEEFDGFAVAVFPRRKMERSKMVVVLRVDLCSQGNEELDDFDAPVVDRRPMERGVADVVWVRLNIRPFGMKICHGAVDKPVAQVPSVFPQVLPDRIFPEFCEVIIGRHLFRNGQYGAGFRLPCGFFCSDQGRQREATEARTDEGVHDPFVKLESRLHNEILRRPTIGWHISDKSVTMSNRNMDRISHFCIHVNSSRCFSLRGVDPFRP
jgi:hypothetical protein